VTAVGTGKTLGGPPVVVGGGVVEGGVTPGAGAGDGVRVGVGAGAPPPLNARIVRPDGWDSIGIGPCAGRSAAAAALLASSSALSPRAPRTSGPRGAGSGSCSAWVSSCASTWRPTGVSGAGPSGAKARCRPSANAGVRRWRVASTAAASVCTRTKARSRPKRGSNSLRTPGGRPAPRSATPTAKRETGPSGSLNANGAAAGEAPRAGAGAGPGAARGPAARPPRDRA
jgi:hypothetical protein